MSKQSEAKVLQHYRNIVACCTNCKNYQSDVTKRPATFSWNKHRTTEKNRRCGIGGFTVQATGYCAFFAWAT